MCFVLQFGMNSLYVMVVHEIVEVQDLPYSEDILLYEQFQNSCGHYVRCKVPCEGHSWLHCEESVRLPSGCNLRE
mgnify:CR=1 FL=1